MWLIFEINFKVKENIFISKTMYSRLKIKDSGIGKYSLNYK